MKWTNSLRRWTMRSIHAAILGSALMGSASIAAAQAPSTAASKISNAHYTRSQTFDLPVEMEAGYRATLTEIRLYVKTPTSGWEQLDKGTAELRRFNIRVAQDGEYWYSLQTVDRQGRMVPPDVNVEAPSQRVIVDSVAPVIQVQAGNTPEGEYCLRCTVQDANPDYATLKAVCKTDQGDRPLEMVPNQPGVFRVKNAELMRFPVVVSVKDLAGNVGTKEVNVRELIAATLGKTPAPADVAQTGGVRTEVKDVPPILPPPRTYDMPTPPVVQPTEKPLAKADGPGTGNRVDFPAPPPPLGGPPNHTQGTSEVVSKSPLPVAPPNQSSVPHQLISTTHAMVAYKIDQVGPSGVGKVEIYWTPDKGQSWHRSTEEVKLSPASINLPGDGVYGIRIVVSNGNGIGGPAPVRGDTPHCTIEVDSTPPFVQLRPAELLASSGHVELRWNATDKNLPSEPVSLFYRTSPDGPWQVIAHKVKNAGVHRWAFPRDAGGQFFFKIEVTDLAGNMSQDVSRQPVMIDMTEPRATILNVTGSGARP